MTTTTTPQTDDELRAMARRRVGMKMGFYIHALVFVLVNSGLYFINSLSMGLGGGVRWHHFPLLGWGLGLAIHGIVTFISLQGMGVRERMVEREIELLRHRQQ
jgi:Xaa-Pro aminopeptidase